MRGSKSAMETKISWFQKQVESSHTVPYGGKAPTPCQMLTFAPSADKSLDGPFLLWHEELAVPKTG